MSAICRGTLRCILWLPMECALYRVVIMRAGSGRAAEQQRKRTELAAALAVYAAQARLAAAAGPGHRSAPMQEDDQPGAASNMSIATPNPNVAPLQRRRPATGRRPCRRTTSQVAPAKIILLCPLSIVENLLVCQIAITGREILELCGHDG
jgi:hypothetical protein